MNNSNQKYKWTIIALILILISTILLFTSNQLKNDTLITLSQQLGSAFFGIGIVILVEENFIKKQIFGDLILGITDFVNNGFVGFYPNRNIDNIKKELEKAQKEIIIISLTAYSPIYLFRDTLIKVCSKNKSCNLTFLLIDSQSEAIKIWEKSLNINGINEEINNSVTYIKEISEELNNIGYKGNLQVKLYNELPLYAGYFIDSRILFYNPYLHGVGGANTPTFKMRNYSNLFNKYYSNVTKVLDSSRTEFSNK